MKITANKRFTTEEFDSAQRSWIGKLLTPLNALHEQVIQALSQGLTLRENLKSQVFDVTVVANQTYPIKQAYRLNEKPTEVRISALREATGATPSYPYNIYWQYVGNNIEITFLGLDVSKAYTITVTAQV